ncbi:monosaccharide-sensing protein 2-like [Impatiens glandulifera]|uniref:monosaccharide-sensing protein 2-like n=1 Tax=Impatiens glandulifera TaxID=253017 RepID=UPI001FB09046|nr:monosaccharide-sensing protein 2-like [Impatiens glandulifera]
MNQAVLVAIAATIGNFLQGWDNAAISGAIVYIKAEADLAATLEGLVVAMSLIGATLITTCSGSISDSIGRRPMLIMSSVFYFISGLVMLWSPNVYVLLVARLLDGFGIGLAVTLVPIYISETAPSDIRGTLNTLPQFTGSGAMFLSYCMIFGMSLMSSPSWRVMLGVLSIPSVLYLVLTVFYLPESPRWLVSKGKMLEAKQVLQKLRGREDVSGEMALLVEGLAVGGETSIEEYVIGPEGEIIDDQDPTAKDGIKLYGPQEGLSWIAKPVTAGQSSLALVSRQGSMVNQTVPLMDPLVTLFGSVHEKLPESGSMIGHLFPRFGSMFSTAEDPHVKNQHSDEESLHIEGGDYGSHDEQGAGEEFDDDGDNLRSPLISRQTTSLEKDGNPIPTSHGSIMSMRGNSSLAQASGVESVGSNIGGGWQLAWKWSEKDGELKRVYLHQEGVAGTGGSRQGSLISLTGDSEFVQAAALVSQSALCSKELLDINQVGPAMVQPSETVLKKSSVWSALRDPGVKRALMVGIGIQILQQFAGINGVMYYTPQILEQAGVEVLLSDLGIGSDSSSFLISAVTMLLELPCIAVAMKLMDTSGRRTLLLTTIPVLTLSLVVLVIGNIVNFGTTVHAIISTICVILYFCTFVMGYGPIPNILCSEIFPTRVRGVCIAICCLVYWICDIIVTYTLPIMLTSIGLAGVFGIYCVVCIISWIFIFLKVPETKGMPLEVITEFFSVGARQTASKNE